MKKWEYDYVKINAGSVINMVRLNDLGNDGWELINVLAIPEANIYYLKKEKFEKMEPVDDH